DIASCMQKSFKTIAMNKTDFEPPRGFSSHPEYCWRIFDHQREQVLHEQDYSNFPNTRTVLSPTGLADARAEIQSESRYETLNSDSNNTSFTNSNEPGGSNGEYIPNDQGY